MKNFRLFIIILSILILCGCDNEHKHNIGTWCDKEYNIEYLYEEHLYGAGLTVRLDENGNVIHCEKGEDKNERIN